MTEFSRKAQLLCWMAYLIALPASWPWLPSMVGEDGKQMARGGYIATMLITTLPLPWVMGGGLLKWLKRHPNKLNLPNKDYWLASNRTYDTWSRVDGLMLRLGWMIWSMLALIHCRAVTAPGDKAGSMLFSQSNFDIVMFVLVIVMLVDVARSTMVWRVPQAELEAFRAQHRHGSAEASDHRAIRSAPQSGPSSRSHRRGEPR